MSNTVPYDPLLARYLAGELDARLRGRACAAAPLFAPDLSATLPLDRGEELRFDLHPTRGWTRLLPRQADADTELAATVVAVDAPADERVLRLRLRDENRFRDAERTLVVELHTNQWNALLVGGDRRIHALLRGRRAGERGLWPGAEYQAPPPAGRLGADPLETAEAETSWHAALGPLPPRDRRRALLRGFAYTGAASAGWILGEAATSPDEAALAAAFRRWWWLRSLPAPEPCLLRVEGARVPFPLALAGLAERRTGSLLEAMEAVAAGPAEADDTAAARRDDEGLAEELEARAAAARRRVASLEAELGRAGEADALRTRGDLLLANLHRVPRGAERVRLEGWEGEPVEIELDPSLSPADNAARWYDRARRRTRAVERIPALLGEARAAAARWDDAAAAARAGAAPDWARSAVRRVEPRPEEPQAAPPFRVFRTSGGLEVRVGRGAKENDRLTFRHSTPNDVWLHARSVPGSHVILRWPDPEGAPPSRDLHEAAGLAAWFSKARTSGTVAVDWTRRKHVRKPRGAAPGAVVPQRVKTVFVEPDEGLEGRLRDEGMNG